MSDIFRKPPETLNFEIEGYRPEERRLDLTKQLDSVVDPVHTEAMLTFLDNIYRQIRQAVVNGKGCQVQHTIVEFGKNGSKYLEVHYKP